MPGRRPAASFTPEKGGIYKVLASGLDEKENQVSSATYMWVSGRNYINWRQENNDRIDLVADQKQYKVGDTATILIPHPYQGDGPGADHRRARAHLPALGADAEDQLRADRDPHHRGPDPQCLRLGGHRQGARTRPTPLPSFKIGYVQLPIDTTEKEI